MKRLVFTLDLVDAREAIAEYEAWHLRAPAVAAPAAEVAVRRKPVTMHGPRARLTRSESHAVARGRAEFLAFRSAAPTAERSAAERVARRSQ